MSLVEGLNPFTAAWCDQFLFIPLLEGAARVERARSGVDLHHEDRPIGWGGRAVNLLAGVVLCVPLVGAVVWLFWKTFGQPESLWRLPITIPPAPPPPVARAAAPAAAAAAADIIHREYDDSKWTIISTGDDTFQAHCDYKSLDIHMDAWYRGGQLQKMVRDVDSQNIQMELTGNQLTVSSGSEKKTHTLPEGFVWIQQPTLGLESFFRSNATELNYCAVNTKQTVSHLGVTVTFLDLVAMKARKTARGEIEFSVLPPWLVPEWASRKAFLGHIQFNPETFVVTKMYTEGLLGVKENSTLVPSQNDPSPEAERP